MLLFGVVVAFVFGIQMELVPEQKQRMVGSLLWLATFFAGTSAIDRSFAGEREEDCWEGLLLYPSTAATVFLAKVMVNVLALAALQCVLIPMFVVFSDVPLLAHPWPLLLAAFLGNLGIAALGTLVSALAAGIGRRGNLLVILVLPMAVPVVIASAEATRLAIAGAFGAEWWRWVQLQAVFATVYVTAGTLLFGFVVED
jgi:heme exporter protein B